MNLSAFSNRLLMPVLLFTWAATGIDFLYLVYASVYTLASVVAIIALVGAAYYINLKPENARLYADNMLSISRFDLWWSISVSVFSAAILFFFGKYIIGSFVVAMFFFNFGYRAYVILLADNN